MEYRRLGRSGLMVPALSLGTGTFGGVGRLAAWGTTDATEARRLLDICLEAGVSMFDTADVYSLGESERVSFFQRPSSSSERFSSTTLLSQMTR